MKYGSCYVLNGLKLCIPRWKGAKAPLKVQGASRIHLDDDNDVMKIQAYLSLVQSRYLCTFSRSVIGARNLYSTIVSMVFEEK